MLNPDESAQQFREPRRIRPFFLRMMLNCLECVRQFEVSILNSFSRERERKQFHFDGILF
jgi:hypothetical protein